MDGINDYELLYYWSQREELVLLELRKRYLPFVYKIVNTCLSSAKQCAIYKEDLIEEALFSLLEAASAYRESQGCSFSSFFYTCAYRRVKTTLRHYLREANSVNLYAMSLDAPVREEEGLYMVDYCSDSGMSDPAQILHYKEAFERVQEVLENLSDQEKKVWYVYQEDCSYQKAAQILGCSQKKYDNTIQKIKRLIKRRLEE